MGMYPNGLRVIRDISPELLEKIRNEGAPFGYRRWKNHDGTEVMTAEESVLSEGQQDLESIGIRRWRLQKVLFDQARLQGIPIFFDMAVMDLVTKDENGLVDVTFSNGTHRQTQILFGADGTHSAVRELLAGTNTSKLEYSGVTCLMGLAECPKEEQGICSPSATTTKCHAVFFPTGEKEQCFQFYFPVPKDQADPGNWGTLSEGAGKEECQKLAQRLRGDGWHERYLQTLDEMTHSVRIGFCSLEPSLEKWVYDYKCVLLGDAAHPPLPYTGQGAQMGLEDAGSLALLIKAYCLEPDGSLNLDTEKFGKAMRVYEQLRIPRTRDVHQCAIQLGHMQQKRADSRSHDRKLRMTIQRQVFFHETMPEMLPGAKYDYRLAVEQKVLHPDKVQPHHRLQVVVEER
jgi:salicylate hydroxylase